MQIAGIKSNRLYKFNFYKIFMPADAYGFNNKLSAGNSVIIVSILFISQTCMGCCELIFSEIVKQINRLADSIIALFTCTISQSLSEIPLSRLIALTPRKHRSAF